MNLRQLHQFVAVAEAASLRKAADKLHMAQPPLTVAIRRLEAELGGRLLDRTSKGVSLTPLGQAALADARKVVFHVEQVGKAAVNSSQGLTGSLSIAFVGSANYTLLPRTLPRFRERYPLVTLSLRERTTTQILRDVESGALDVGLVRYPIFEPTTADVLEVEPDELVVVLPRTHALAGSKRLRLRDLRNEPFVMYSSVAATNLRGHVMLICQSSGFRPQVAQEAVQVQTLIGLVESGLGVALVPSISQRHGPSGVVFVPLDAPRAQLLVGLAVVTRPQLGPSPTRHFKDLLMELQQEQVRASLRRRRSGPGSSPSSTPPRSRR